MRNFVNEKLPFLASNKLENLKTYFLNLQSKNVNHNIFKKN